MRLLAVVFAFGYSMSAVAGAVSSPSLLSDPGYLEIGKVSVKEIQDPEAVLQDPQTDYPVPAPGSGIPELDEAEVILDKIINMGSKIWKIVEANRPVVRFRSEVATATPQGLQSWEQLSGWQAPRARVYEVNYENLYGMTVVKFSFRVSYTFGGSVNGKGRYLAQVSVQPVQLDVSWGYTFNADMSVTGVTNAGTSRDPMAAMELLLKWSVDTVLKHSESTASFYARGDGQFLNLTDGN